MLFPIFTIDENTNTSDLLLLLYYDSIQLAFDKLKSINGLHLERCMVLNNIHVSGNNVIQQIKFIIMNNLHVCLSYDF